MTGERGTIVIVEDDAAIAGGLSMNLKLEGFVTETVSNGNMALPAVHEHRPILLLLDISLPGQSGLDALSEIREAGLDLPVIILSAHRDEYDKVAALRLGADDYVTKPFGVAELLARIDAVLRRTQAKRAEPAPVKPNEPEEKPPEFGLRFADVSVDLDTRVVRRGGQPVQLTHLQFELLRWFVEHPAKVFDRHSLLRAVWGIEHTGSPRTVDNFVGQLRQKFEADPNDPQHFVTVRGSGYRFDP